MSDEPLEIRDDDSEDAISSPGINDSLNASEEVIAEARRLAIVGMERALDARRDVAELKKRLEAAKSRHNGLVSRSTSLMCLLPREEADRLFVTFEKKMRSIDGGKD